MVPRRKKKKKVHEMPRDKEPTMAAEFRFADADRQGVVTAKPGPFGVDIEVKHRGVKWVFAIDLYHLSPAGKHEDPSVQGCVQIVAYHPQAPNADPVQHLRVWPDGQVETFKA